MRSIQVVLIGVLASGCTANNNGNPPQCDEGDASAPECPSGDRCIDFVCRLLCETPEGCGPVETCTADGYCLDVAQECNSHGECPNGFFCDNSACVKKKPAGAACDSAATCLSEFCVDMVCCDQVCDQACRGCNQALTAVASGSCANTALGVKRPGDCPDPVSCNGLGSCAFLSDGELCTTSTQCTSAACESGVCCAVGGDCCTIDDDCVSASYACDDGSGVCRATCASDADCKLGFHCTAPTCTSNRAAGQTCTRDGECTSGRCESGLCCNGGDDCCASDSGCITNNACNTTSSVCYTSCASDGDGHCKTGVPCIGGQCGVGSANGTPCATGGECASGRCDAGYCCGSGAECCSGNADCPAQYACEVATHACRSNCSSDAHCKPTGYCAGTSCAAKKANGSTCVLAAECTSGVCESGVCCALGGDCCLNNTGCTNGLACQVTTKTCYLACTSDAECQSTHYCSSPACVPKVVNGTLCSVATTCLSGYCVDGRCCDTSCVGECRGCNYNTATRGTCTLYPATTDPQNECSALPCWTGACDGTGACEQKAVGAPCGACDAGCNSSAACVNDCGAQGCCVACNTCGSCPANCQ